MTRATVYALRDDIETIASIQRATLETEEYGLEPDPALFGSADWWAAIDRGDLLVHEVAGRISKVYWASMNDWAEFELRTIEGETSTWTRLGDHTRYVEGLEVSVSFVQQRFKAAGALRHGLHEANHVLEIIVEESRLRSSRYAPGPFLIDAPWKTAEYIDAVRTRLASAGADLRPGLSDDEVGVIESEFGFQFPSDLRFLLQAMLPVSDHFPDWRSPDRARLRERLDWPADGICFDIEHNDFWLEDWGDRPPGLEDAMCIARERVHEAPILIPIYSHRYIPAEPLADGNPVFSVYQTDIIYYGADLPSYFVAEFGLKPPWWAFGKPREGALLGPIGLVAKAGMGPSPTARSVRAAFARSARCPARPGIP
jgi:hypothetical protein